MRHRLLTAGKSPMSMAMNRRGLLRTHLSQSGVLMGVIFSTSSQTLGELSFNATSYPAGDMAVGLALGDLSGDGLPDAVATDTATQSVHIRINDGAGGFGPASVLTLAAGQPRDAAVIDVDGDGDRDLVVAVRDGPSAVLIYRNLGNGQFAAPLGYGPGAVTFSFEISDFNNDNFPDIAYATGMTDTKIGVLLNLGNGAFGEATLHALSNPPITYVADVAAGDVTGDGAADMIGVLANDSTVALFVNNGNGTFSPAQPLSIGNQGFAPEGVALGDLEMDGDLDLAVFEAVHPEPDRVRIAINNGRGEFGNPTTINVGHISTPFTTPMTPVIADVNGDGRGDVAIAQRVIISSSSGFGEAVMLAEPPVNQHFAAASADMNADGLADLAFTWHQNLDSSVSVFLNLPPQPVLGDVNGDGEVDVDDLLAVITNWGVCPVPPPPCLPDIAPPPTGNGVVNVDDLLMVITNWG